MSDSRDEVAGGDKSIRFTSHVEWWLDEDAPGSHWDNPVKAAVGRRVRLFSLREVLDG